MNLFYGEIVDVFQEAKVAMARISARGALTEVILELTPEARPGDRVLVCDGVVLNKVTEEKGEGHVSGDSR